MWFNAHNVGGQFYSKQCKFEGYQVLNMVSQKEARNKNIFAEKRWITDGPIFQ